MTRCVAICVFLVAMVGCDDGGSMPPGPSPDAGISMPRGACETAQRVGGFVIEAQTNYSVLDGQVSDGVVPISVPELVREEAGCRLLRRRNPNCQPACQPGQTCDHSGSCIPFPMSVNIGQVQVFGLEKEVSMEARSPGDRYFDTELPHPVFTPNANITLSSSGQPSLLLVGHGVEPIRPAENTWLIRRGQPLSVQWNEPANARSGEVSMQLTIDQHGTSPLSVQCTFADDGSAEVPAVLVDALLDAGVTGYPNGRIVRRTADSQSVPGGCVDLVVGSPQRMMVRVEGHTPCRRDSDCSGGQRCNTMLERCE